MSRKNPKSNYIIIRFSFDNTLLFFIIQGVSKEKEYTYLPTKIPCLIKNLMRLHCIIFWC